jgi:uncharacterized protein with HEPN domain
VSEGQSTPSVREWRFYLDDMISFAEKVLAYTHDVSRADFERGDLVYDATLRNLELLGEAASHVPEDVRAEAVDIPWRMIVATRNRLAHGYLGIDNDTLWSILQDDVPSLLALLVDLRRKNP